MPYTCLSVGKRRSHFFPLLYIPNLYFCGLCYKDNGCVEYTFLNYICTAENSHAVPWIHGNRVTCSSHSSWLPPQVSWWLIITKAWRLERDQKICKWKTTGIVYVRLISLDSSFRGYCFTIRVSIKYIL